MLLCYTYHITGPGQVHPALAIVADKPDALSVPIPVESLVVTDCALIRLGPLEALRVFQVPEGGIVCSPLPPARLYLTPDLMDKPGIHVRSLRITKDSNGSFSVNFRQEKDGPDAWRPWRPNDVVGS